jgi:hypothetical protein
MRCGDLERSDRLCKEGEIAEDLLYFLEGKGGLLDEGFGFCKWRGLDDDADDELFAKGDRHERARSERVLEEIKKKTYTPKDIVSGQGFFGGFRRYGGYSRYGGGGYSRSGGSGFVPNSYITRMNFFSGVGSARVDNMPMINTNTPLIRRADVRRERVSSERGRLKQWQ